MGGAKILLEKPRVSVIIPVFNAERWIEETLQSVRDQTWPNLEILLVDDGSTDNSIEIVKRFRGHKVNVIKQQNRGVSAARNRAFREASGEFIQYLDADDLLKPDAIKMKVDQLQNTGADVAYSDWIKLVENTDGTYREGEVYKRVIEGENFDLQLAIFTKFWAPPAALLYSRKIVKKIGSWNEKYPIIQDARFMLDAAFYGAQFVHVPGVLAAYRVSQSTSLSRRDPMLFVKEVFMNTQDVERRWLETGGMTDERKKALLGSYDYVARSCFDKRRPLFEAAYRAIIKLDPHYLPRRTKKIMWASRLFGYKNAEFLSTLFQRLKSRLGSRSNSSCHAPK